MSKYDWFNEDDFNRASPACKISDMDPELLARLDMARGISMVPYIITSAYRSVEHEHSKGRDGKSSHTKGLAVDIKATGSRQRYRIIAGLIKAGFHRIGVGETFIHVDDDPDKDPEVIWTYY